MEFIPGIPLSLLEPADFSFNAFDAIVNEAFLGHFDILPLLPFEFLPGTKTLFDGHVHMKLLTYLIHSGIVTAVDYLIVSMNGV